MWKKVWMSGQNIIACTRRCYRNKINLKLIFFQQKNVINWISLCIAHKVHMSRICIYIHLQRNRTQKHQLFYFTSLASNMPWCSWLLRITLAPNIQIGFIVCKNSLKSIVPFPSSSISFHIEFTSLTGNPQLF